jgi:hypothetical protein
MREAGHYAGSTSAGDPISFDVTDEGDVTNIIASLLGSAVSISLRYRIDEQGRWEGKACGDGIRARLHGRLDRAEAVGTLEAELDVAGTHRTTGELRWRARRLPGIAC